MTMKRSTALVLAALVGVGSTASANAVTIDFNSNQNGSNFVSEVQSNGFRAFSNLVENGQDRPIGTNIVFENAGPSNGTVHLDSWTDNGFNSIWTLVRQDQALFTLNTFDFATAAYNGNAAASSVTVTGTLLDNSLVSQTFVPVAGVFQTFTVSSAFTNVRYVRFDSAGFHNRSAYDNIVVAAASPVPEPASWAMMIGGFGLVGGAMRRRSKVRTTASYA